MKMKKTNMKIYFLSFLLAGLAMISYSCNKDNKTSMHKHDEAKPVMDHHSYARPDEAVVNHLSLDLTANFPEKKMYGTASYDITVYEGADSIYLDTKALDIQKVSVDGNDVSFTVGTSNEWLGEPLAIPVSSTSKKIIITYSTRPGAEALQWLEPAQTSGKKYPYLFTQGQAILT